MRLQSRGDLEQGARVCRPETEEIQLPILPPQNVGAAVIYPHQAQSSDTNDSKETMILVIQGGRGADQ